MKMLESMVKNSIYQILMKKFNKNIFFKNHHLAQAEALF